MIDHKNKFIFIHIPKCAGSSIRDFYFETPKLDWRIPNYELLYGWCPERQIHLQHATSKQLLDLDLISLDKWKSYFKFAFVRNPYDRAYSDYLWIKKDREINGSFKEFLSKKGEFKKILTDNTVKEYRGDHLLKQSSFFDTEGRYSLDFIGRFENFQSDMVNLNKALNFNGVFNHHSNRNYNRKNHYSYFYTRSQKLLVERLYNEDLNNFNYDFKDKKKGVKLLKNLF